MAPSPSQIKEFTSQVGSFNKKLVSTTHAEVQGEVQDELRKLKKELKALEERLDRYYFQLI